MMFDQSPPVFRFAPSPNGALHLGHAYSALLNFDLSKKMGGRFLVRAEDIDQVRCTPALERAMLQDLEWLGIEWEQPVRRQSDHFSDYHAALEVLRSEGLVYRSHLSRGDIKRFVTEYELSGKVWPCDPDGAPLFPGRDYEDHASDKDGAYAVRLDMAKAAARVDDLNWTEFLTQTKVKADPVKWGDVVLSRRDAPSSYHLAVVVDDALQGVTHVVRGQDLYEATAVHVLLQQLLGLPQPVYFHHELILDDNGEKLSKSRGDTSLNSLREGEITPRDIRRMINIPLCSDPP